MNKMIDKIVMLQKLKNDSFVVPHYTKKRGGELSDITLTDHLIQRRKLSDYEIDGVVIDVNSATKRKQMNSTRDTLNPAYSVKYKIANKSNQATTTVICVKWNLSKHGYWKPTIHFEPVELCGVTITNCTGFNAKFIYDNSIGEGAKIQITRSGDVIPFIQKTIEPAESWQEPDGDWEWTDTGVDAIATNVHEHDIVRINQLIDFFSSIDAPYLKKGNIQKLFDEGYDSHESIILLSEKEFERILGENGKKAYVGLKEKLTNIPLYKLIGAYSTERGIGVRRMKMLDEAFGQDYLMLLPEMELRIVRVDRFDKKTAKKVVNVVTRFNIFYEKIKDRITLASHNNLTSLSLSGEKIVFTGFRDKSLQEQVETAGGTIQNSVSSKTTIVVTVVPNSNSGKIKKARDLGVKIMGVDEFKHSLNNTN